MASRCPLSISASIPSYARYVACLRQPTIRAAVDTPPYDLIAIGAGPAGLTAATEAARAGLKVLCLDKLAPGGALINLRELHDFDEIWNGSDMAARMPADATGPGLAI